MHLLPYRTASSDILKNAGGLLYWCSDLENKQGCTHEEYAFIFTLLPMKGAHLPEIKSANIIELITLTTDTI